MQIFRTLNDPRSACFAITISSFNGALLFGERRCFSPRLSFFFSLFFLCALHEIRFTALPLRKKERAGRGRDERGRVNDGRDDEEANEEDVPACLVRESKT